MIPFPRKFLTDPLDKCHDENEAGKEYVKAKRVDWYFEEGGGKRFSFFIVFHRVREKYMAILRVEPIMAAENCRESARVNVARKLGK